MPTYSLPGATALLTGDDVTGIQTSEIFLSVAPGVTSFSYIMLPEEADPLPPVEIEVDEIAVFERLPDGTTRDVSQADAQFGQIVWVQGGVFNTSYVLLLSNAAQTVVSYYQIGGAALPPLTTVAQFDAFSDTIIFAGAVTSGPFAPGSDIPLAGLIGVTVEDGIAAPGTTGNDITPGSAGDDDLFGLAGRDRLGGSLGDDTMEGGRDNDTYVVNSAGDLIVGEIGFAQGGGIDTVEVSIDNYVLPTNVELLRLQGSANLTATGNDAPGTLVGNSGNNTLYGRGGNDQINGNDGNDTLIGGVGRDTLVGGTGADRFVFTAVADSRAGPDERDFINGFDHGADRIDLSLIDANPFATGDQAFVFIGSSNFGGLGAASAGQVQSRSYGANYSIVSIDRDGNGVAEMQIFVNLTATMAEGDFIL